MMSSLPRIVLLSLGALAATSGIYIGVLFVNSELATKSYWKSLEFSLPSLPFMRSQRPHPPAVIESHEFDVPRPSPLVQSEISTELAPPYISNVEHEIPRVPCAFVRQTRATVGFLHGSANAPILWLTQIPRWRYLLLADLEGHTDTTGTLAYNEVLSRQRADFAKKLLQSEGISRSAIGSVRGYGYTRPAVNTPPNTPEPANRRADILIIE
jgi:hypothetical protein